MNLTAFQLLRDGLQANGAPARAQVRQAAAASLHRELEHLGVLDEIEVGTTEQADHLLVVLGTFRSHLAEEQVARAVEHAWDAVAFGHWESHAFLVEDGHVELQGATMDRPAGDFLTLHLVVNRSDVAAAPVVPSQRSGSTAFAPAQAR